MSTRVPSRSAWTWAATLAGALGLIGPTTASAQDYATAYNLAPSPAHVDLGVQPMAYPLAFISSTLQRDRILRAGLKDLGLQLRAFPFRKGNDIVGVMGGGKIEVAFLGDMPTVNSLIRTPICIAGLGKRNFSSIVSRSFSRIEELKGKRIGYSPGSSSHLVLLRGLKAARMAENDVVLVPMEPAEMPEALEKGSVEAFSAWEPVPSISLARNPRNRAIYRGMSTDWVVLSREFVTQQPRGAQLIVAAYVRAINWMRSSARNADQAGRWVLADGQAFMGAAPALPLAKAVEIVRNDLLDVPGAPAVPSKVDGLPPLQREFEFLQQQGRIAPTLGISLVTEAFAYGGLKAVQADPKKHRLFDYDYES